MLDDGTALVQRTFVKPFFRHHGRVPAERPRTYQARTSPGPVRTPNGPLWERAVDVIRRDPPPYEGRFVHRDFHPGYAFFTGTGPTLRITGVVDWVETSWGPADLDIAHCSTPCTAAPTRRYWPGLGVTRGAEYGTQLRRITPKLIAAAKERVPGANVRALRILPPVAAAAAAATGRRPADPAEPVQRHTASDGYRRALETHRAAARARAKSTRAWWRRRRGGPSRCANTKSRHAGITQGPPPRGRAGLCVRCRHRPRRRR
ncbi:phosphotransferase [Streptomyces sp. NPDC058595]|uniref:phosphotransferase n=1 Tax=Streptomyces sp. NPDC058595 TaxID=3346550 RepID=UPI0036482D55